MRANVDLFGSRSMKSTCSLWGMLPCYIWAWLVLVIQIQTNDLHPGKHVSNDEIRRQEYSISMNSMNQLLHSLFKYCPCLLNIQITEINENFSHFRIFVINISIFSLWYIYVSAYKPMALSAQGQRQFWKIINFAIM